MSTPNEPYELARRRVIAKTVYTGVVGLWALLAVLQIAIWYLTTPGGYFWPAWPILGTIIAAIAWGVPIYARRPVVSERRIQAEMARMRGNN
jgi:polyferredoxin